MRSRITQGTSGDHAVPAGDGDIDGLPWLLRDCAGQGRSVFLFGGDGRTAYAVWDRAASAIPGLRIAGFCDADFAGPVDRAVLDHIAAANADVILSDLTRARFRLFCAQCAGAGLHGRRFNLPGSFPDFAFGTRGGFDGRGLPGQLRRIAASAKDGVRFARIVLIQALRRARPHAVAARDRAVSSRR